MATIITDKGIFTGDIEDLKLFGRISLKPKLYSLWSGDYNDRQEFFRVKAYDLNHVISWICTPDNDQILNLKDFTIEELIQDIDYQDGGLAYIMLNNCLECDNYNTKTMKPRKPRQCEYCEIGTAYIEISEIENPQPEDFSFKIVFPYGQNNYIDLTKVTE